MISPLNFDGAPVSSYKGVVSDGQIIVIPAGLRCCALLLSLASLPTLPVRAIPPRDYLVDTWRFDDDLPRDVLELSLCRMRGRDFRFVLHGSFSSPRSSNPQTHTVCYGAVLSEVDEVGD